SHPRSGGRHYTPARAYRTRMPLTPINIGTSPGSGDGDPLRTALNKANENDAYLELLVESRAPFVHVHDERYYTKATVDDLISNAPVPSHNHAIADVTGLQDALNGKAATSHSHAVADVTGLQNALDNKAATGHKHAIAHVTDI